MTKLALVTPDGVPIDLDKKTPTPSQADTSEEPLHVIAARQHAKDSTKKGSNQS
jgi:hypothetical protein